jgi:hypothetical protein
MDETGVIQYINFGDFEVHRAETRKLVETWFKQGVSTVATLGETDDTPFDARALELFDRGLVLYRAGKVSEATTQWRKAIEFDPKNWIICKQLWAVENPGKFYDGGVDYGWQREQIERDR